MSDIVERLRKRKRAKGFEYSVDPVTGHNVLDTVYEPDPECLEAADEIERLREALKIVRVAVENFGMTGGNDRFALGYVDELARETLEAKDE